MTLSAAFPHLAQRCHIGVITAFYAHIVQKSSKLFFQIHLGPSQIDSLVDDTFTVNRSRRAHTHACHIFFYDGFLKHFILDTVRNIRQNIASAVLCPGRNLPLVQHVAV